MPHRLFLTAAAVSSCVLGQGALAQSAAQHVDIMPFDDNGKIATGFFDFEAGAFVTDARRFSEPLDAIQSSFIGVQAPGFLNTTQFPLLAGTALSFDIPALTHPDTGQLHNLLYWDGLDDGGDGLDLDDVDFAPPTDGQTLEVRLSSFVNATADGSGADVPGFALDVTDGDGTLHKHVSYLVRGDAGNQPPDGFYLLPLQLTMPGLDDSDPFYLLFNGKYQRDEQDNILFNGILPLTDLEAQGVAEEWIDTFLLAAALAGDYNADGAVDQGDLDLVLLNWGDDAGATGVPAGWVNETPTGLIGQTELDGVLLNWGNTSEAAAAAVPEPAALVLLAAALPALTNRRSAR